jgi:hypothetical protein
MNESGSGKTRKPRRKKLSDSCVPRTTAAIFLLREYLVHYLPASRTSISRTCRVYDEAVICHLLNIPAELQKEMELRLIFFNPAFSTPPVTALRINLDYFSPSMARLIQQPWTLRRQGGYAALQLCLKDESESKVSEEVSGYFRVWLLLDEKSCKALSSSLPLDSAFFLELNFELQVMENFRLYGGSRHLPPSLN